MPAHGALAAGGEGGISVRAIRHCRCHGARSHANHERGDGFLQPVHLQGFVRGTWPVRKKATHVNFSSPALSTQRCDGDQAWHGNIRLFWFFLSATSRKQDPHTPLARTHIHTYIQSTYIGKQEARKWGRKQRISEAVGFRVQNMQAHVRHRVI